MDITDNDFVLLEHLVEELPDDFFFDQIKERVKQDPLTLLMKKRLVVQNVETSQFVFVDYEKKEMNVGPKESGVPLYYIEPDYVPCDMVLDYYDKYCEDENTKFPNVPRAEPVVPINKIYKPDEEYRLESSMMNRSCYLAEPKPGQYERLGAAGEFATKDGRGGTKKYSEIVGKAIFQSYNDTLLNEVEAKNAIRICMQFNPFHPMSKEKITSFEWDDENKCHGTYKYREREDIRFEFDLQSRLYRIHSDQWIPNLGLPSGIYENYDLVSDKPFAEYLFFSKVNNNLEPLIIEPITRSEDVHEEKGIYSILGPWRGFISKGCGEITYSPSLTSKHVNINEGQYSVFKDITEECDFDTKKMVLVHEYRPGKRVQYVFFQSEGKVKKIQRRRKPDKEDLWMRSHILRGRDVFIKINKYSVASFEWRAFKKVMHPTKVKHPYYWFCEVQGAQFRSFPTNEWGTICYGLRAISMMEALTMNRRKHEFLPLIVPIPDRTAEFDNMMKDLDYDVNIDEVHDDFDVDFSDEN